MQGVGKTIRGGIAKCRTTLPLIHFPLKIEEILSKFRRIAPKPALPPNTNNKKSNQEDKDLDDSSCSKIIGNARSRKKKQAAANHQQQLTSESYKKKRRRSLDQFLQPGASSTSCKYVSSSSGQIKSSLKIGTKNLMELPSSIQRTTHVMASGSHNKVVYPKYNSEVSESSAPKVLTAPDIAEWENSAPLVGTCAGGSAVNANVGLTEAEGGGTGPNFRCQCNYKELTNKGSSEKVKSMMACSCNLASCCRIAASPVQSFSNQVSALPSACRQKLVDETEADECITDQQEVVLSSSRVNGNCNVMTLSLFPQETLRSTELQDSSRNVEEYFLGSESEFSNLTQLRLLPSAESTSHIGRRLENNIEDIRTFSAFRNEFKIRSTEQFWINYLPPRSMP